MINQTDYLVQCLVEESIIDAHAVEQARHRASEQGMTIEEALVSSGMVSPRDVALTRATLCECPLMDLAHYDIDIRNAAMLPRSVAEKHRCFPLFETHGVVTVGMVDPLNLRAIDQLRQVLKTDLDPVLCVPDALGSLIHRAYSLMPAEGSTREHEAREARELTTGDEPIVAAVNHILADAVETGSSDVHISPCEHELQLRYRIDGQLQCRQGPPLSAHPGLVQRLKVMANLDLTQTRRPQDGKFRFSHGGESIEIRLSTIPTICGENVVMRVLRPQGQILDFKDLGIPEQEVSRLHEALDHPHGMLLVTGPTGSGKTTTLYSAIKHINTPSRNIMTIEDPVEIRMHGIRQVQTNAAIGMTFAGALRSILRQDPDVVLVGEIRDAETAVIATQASLTGHLVLSTLHTNDAAGAVTRLRDLGVPPFVINASLLGVLAQRLVRRICINCVGEYAPEPFLLRRFGLETGDPFRCGTGCSRCAGTGYRGRVGVYEYLRISPEVAAAIDNNATTRELHEVALIQGMRAMWRDGLHKARTGQTTLEEVARTVALAEQADAPDATPLPIDAGDDLMRLSA